MSAKTWKAVDYVVLDIVARIFQLVGYLQCNGLLMNGLRDTTSETLRDLWGQYNSDLTEINEFIPILKRVKEQ